MSVLAKGKHMPGIVEIRNYHLKTGCGERFERIMREQSPPLLSLAGTAVVTVIVPEDKFSSVEGRGLHVPR